MKNTALVFKMRTKNNLKNCTIFNALVSIPFVFTCVTVGLHLKSLCVLQLASNYWHCQSSKQGEPGALGLQATTRKVPLVSVIPRLKCWQVLTVSKRLLPCVSRKSSKQFKEHQGSKTRCCSSQATYRKQKVGFFACHWARNHLLLFWKSAQEIL